MKKAPSTLSQLHVGLRAHRSVYGCPIMCTKGDLLPHALFTKINKPASQREGANDGK